MKSENCHRHRYTAESVAPLGDETARKVLVATGLPSEHLLFSAVNDLVMTFAAGRSLLKVGEVSVHDDLCIDIRTGEVVEVSEHDGELIHVNSSLRQFDQSLDVFADYFPFSCGRSSVEPEESAQRLRKALLRIDSTIFLDDPGFWGGVILDVALGDYSEAD